MMNDNNANEKQQASSDQDVSVTEAVTSSDTEDVPSSPPRTNNEQEQSTQVTINADETLGRQSLPREQIHLARQTEDEKESKRTTTTSVGAFASLPGRSTLSDFERDVQTKTASSRPTTGGTTRPGAVAVSGTSSLAALEADVLSKSSSCSSNVAQAATTTRSDARAPSSTLGQLEAGVLQKSASRPADRAVRPGAVVVSGPAGPPSNLSRLEQGVLAKSSASQQGRPATTTASLGELERDVLEKASVGRSGATRPGAVAVSGSAGRTKPSRGDAPSSLSRLEEEALAKAQASSGRRTENTAASLTQLEQDVTEKSSAGQGRAVRPGAVAVSGSASSAKAAPGDALVNLSRLEEDVLSKVRASQHQQPTNLAALERDVLQKSTADEPRASLPGAVSVHKPAPGTKPDRGDAPASLSRLEQDVLTKATSSDVGAATNLHNLERDILDKGRAGPSPSAPGAYAISGEGKGTRVFQASGPAALSQLEQDALAKSRASHNRTAQNTVDSLGQLERDVLAKSSTGVAARSPGAVAFGDEESNARPPSDLSRIEEDVLAKSRAASSGGFRSEVPGAVSSNETGDRGSPPASLSAREDEVLAKSKVSQPTPMLSAEANLDELERDVLAKSAGKVAPASRPGAVASYGSAHLSQAEAEILSKQAPQTAPQSGLALHELERDVLEKSGTTAAGATMPGAVSMAGGESDHGVSRLSNFEQDVLTKARASQSTAGVSASDRPRNLHQFENDVMEKDAAAGLRGESNHGASRLSTFEQDVLTKARASQSKPVASARPQDLRQVENDVTEKKAAAASSIPASLAALEMAVTTSQVERSIEMSGSQMDSLSQLEIDVLRKGEVAQTVTTSPERAATSLGQLEQDVLEKSSSRNARPARSGVASLTALEAHITNKADGQSVQQAVARDHGQQSIVGMGGMNRLEGLEREIEGKAIVSHVVHGEEQNFSSMGHAEASQARLDAGDVNHIGLAPQQSHQDATPMMPAIGYGASLDIGPGRIVDEPRESYSSVQRNLPPAMGSVQDLYRPRPPTQPLSQSVDPVDTDPEQPLAQTEYVNRGTTGVVAGGIEAFVADPNVVDATDVEIIPSEEEESKRWHQNRRFCLIGLAFVILVIAVVVPVVVVVGGDSNGSQGVASETTPTPAPTRMPTATPTMAPTSSVLPGIIEALVPVSGVQSFMDRASPQFKAAEWLAEFDEYVRKEGLTVSDPKFLQRYALAVFFFSLDGENWRGCKREQTCSVDPGLNSWLSDTGECTWYRVTCDGGNVTDLTFRMISTDIGPDDDTVLSGVLPKEIQVLSNLQKFTVHGMKLRGPLTDQFSNASKLDTLILSSNSLSGSVPDNLSADNPNLVRLVLSDNEINGSLPLSLGSLTNLIELRLDRNEMSGVIQNETIANLQNLEVLELFGNAFSGELPLSLYSLSSLQFLRTDSTSIEGTIPQRIGQLQNLKELRLGPSKMSGPLPDNLYTLQNLTFLDLSDSQFSGTLSWQVRALGDTMIDFHLQNNLFSGTVPPALGNFGIAESILLFGNNFTGTVPDALCDNRGNGAGLLFELKVDCDAVECTCCNPCDLENPFS